MIKAIIRTDTHIPYEDKKTIEVIRKFERDNKFDYWIHLGDLVDLNELSRFNEEAPRRKTEKTMETFKRANEYLDIEQEIIRKNNKDAKFVLLEGNHEFRVETFMDKFPELTGLLEIEKNLHLKERGIKWI